jgi:hypothetical protein
MKVVLDIPDNEATFAMRVLKSLSFVKSAKPMSVSAVGLWDDLQGKIKLKTAQQLLDEL